MLRAVNALLPFEIYEAICYFCAINDMKMKKIKLFFAVFCTLVFCLQSCDNGKTYAEIKEEEADAINAWILNHNYQVISEKDFYNQDTITNENQFVLFEESGVYMNILQQGEGDSKLADGYYEIASRYIEVAIQTRDEMFSAGDTLCIIILFIQLTQAGVCRSICFIQRSIN